MRQSDSLPNLAVIDYSVPGLLVTHPTSHEAEPNSQAVTHLKDDVEGIVDMDKFSNIDTQSCEVGIYLAWRSDTKAAHANDDRHVGHGIPSKTSPSPVSCQACIDALAVIGNSMEKTVSIAQQAH